MSRKIIPLTTEIEVRRYTRKLFLESIRARLINNKNTSREILSEMSVLSLPFADMIGMTQEIATSNQRLGMWALVASQKGTGRLGECLDWLDSIATFPISADEFTSIYSFWGALIMKDPYDDLLLTKHFMALYAQRNLSFFEELIATLNPSDPINILFNLIGGATGGLGFGLKAGGKEAAEEVIEPLIRTALKKAEPEDQLLDAAAARSRDRLRRDSSGTFPGDEGFDAGSRALTKDVSLAGATKKSFTGKVVTSSVDGLVEPEKIVIAHIDDMADALFSRRGTFLNKPLKWVKDGDGGYDDFINSAKQGLKSRLARKVTAGGSVGADDALSQIQRQGIDDMVEAVFKDPKVTRTFTELWDLGAKTAKVDMVFHQETVNQGILSILGTTSKANALGTGRKSARYLGGAARPGVGLSKESIEQLAKDAGQDYALAKTQFIDKRKVAREIVEADGRRAEELADQMFDQFDLINKFPANAIDNITPQEAIGFLDENAEQFIIDFFEAQFAKNLDDVGKAALNASINSAPTNFAAIMRSQLRKKIHKVLDDGVGEITDVTGAMSKDEIQALISKLDGGVFPDELLSNDPGILALIKSARGDLGSSADELFKGTQEVLETQLKRIKIFDDMTREAFDELDVYGEGLINIKDLEIIEGAIREQIGRNRLFGATMGIFGDASMTVGQRFFNVLKFKIYQQGWEATGDVVGDIATTSPGEDPETSPEAFFAAGKDFVEEKPDEAAIEQKKAAFKKAAGVSTQDYFRKQAKAAKAAELEASKNTENEEAAEAAYTLERLRYEYNVANDAELESAIGLSFERLDRWGKGVSQYFTTGYADKVDQLGTLMVNPEMAGIEAANDMSRIYFLGFGFIKRSAFSYEMTASVLEELTDHLGRILEKVAKGTIKKAEAVKALKLSEAINLSKTLIDAIDNDPKIATNVSRSIDGAFKSPPLNSLKAKQYKIDFDDADKKNVFMRNFGVSPDDLKNIGATNFSSEKINKDREDAKKALEIIDRNPSWKMSEPSSEPANENRFSGKKLIDEKIIRRIIRDNLIKEFKKKRLDGKLLLENPAGPEKIESEDDYVNYVVSLFGNSSQVGFYKPNFFDIDNISNVNDAVTFSVPTGAPTFSGWPSAMHKGGLSMLDVLMTSTYGQDVLDYSKATNGTRIFLGLRQNLKYAEFKITLDQGSNAQQNPGLTVEKTIDTPITLYTGPDTYSAWAMHGGDFSAINAAGDEMLYHLFKDDFPGVSDRSTLAGKSETQLMALADDTLSNDTLVNGIKLADIKTKIIDAKSNWLLSKELDKFLSGWSIDIDQNIPAGTPGVIFFLSAIYNSNEPSQISIIDTIANATKMAQVKQAAASSFKSFKDWIMNVTKPDGFNTDDFRGFTDGENWFPWGGGQPFVFLPHIKGQLTINTAFHETDITDVVSKAQGYDINATLRGRIDTLKPQADEEETTGGVGITVDAGKQREKEKTWVQNQAASGAKIVAGSVDDSSRGNTFIAEKSIAYYIYRYNLDKKSVVKNSEFYKGMWEPATSRGHKINLSFGDFPSGEHTEFRRLIIDHAIDNTVGIFGGGYDLPPKADLLAASDLGWTNSQGTALGDILGNIPGLEAYNPAGDGRTIYSYALFLRDLVNDEKSPTGKRRGGSGSGGSGGSGRRSGGSRRRRVRTGERRASVQLAQKGKIIIKEVPAQLYTSTGLSKEQIEDVMTRHAPSKAVYNARDTATITFKVDDSGNITKVISGTTGLFNRDRNLGAIISGNDVKMWLRKVTQKLKMLQPAAAPAGGKGNFIATIANRDTAMRESKIRVSRAFNKKKK